MKRLPKEEYFTEETSPDGKYIVKAYAMEVLQCLLLFTVSYGNYGESNVTGIH